MLLKALEKDPKDRFQSAAKLMDALEKALTVTKMPSRLAMPPLPVGVPTIHHSSTSIAELTQRGVTRRAAPATRMAAKPQPATVQANEPPRQAPPEPAPVKAAESAPLPQETRRATASPLWGFLVLILMGAAFLYFNPGMLASLNLPFSFDGDLHSPTPHCDGQPRADAHFDLSADIYSHRDPRTDSRALRYTRGGHRPASRSN